MPTKQEYLDKINTVKEKRYTPSDKERENYEEIKETIPNGANVDQWLKESKDKLSKKLNDLEPEFKKAFNEASEFCEKKKNDLIKFTQDKIKEIDGQIVEFKSKGKDMVGKGEDLFDLRHKQEIYKRSLESLNSYQKGNSMKFSFGEAEWSLDLTEYEPFEKVSEQKKFYTHRQRELDEFENTKNSLDESNKTFGSAVKQMKDELDQKKTAFDALNGWQKLWARVLPASWYSKAKDYADLKNQEAAMKETGLIDNNDKLVVEEFEQKAVEEKSVGEPLSETEAKDLQQKSELFPAKENEKQADEQEKAHELEDKLDGKDMDANMVGF